ncbi:hypothetical protein NUW58_g2783 [Xylaria curta]|uniref:Uncharacterized protein n=1 Tax=Xylaria curta TaxID=42375 RepID=A0ACC1PF55_9PEZI|nr:hypothetical protein NUW58_g2783 [Xylaria curta]
MGGSIPQLPESTGGIARSTPSHESNFGTAGTDHHQNQDDPPPAYTEYVYERPQPHPATLRDQHNLDLLRPCNNSTNAYDQAVYLQNQNSRAQPAPDGLEYASIHPSSPHLRKPIAVPAIAASLGSPFLRAYPPSLEALRIPRGEFLDILDGLNRVAVQSPPLRVLGLVGEALELVPLATAQVVGLAVNAAAQVGTFALSKGATEVYLRKVNKEVFAPRGLKMEIAKLEAMARVNKIPILDAAGKIRGDAQLLRPLLDEQETQTMDPAQRWLQALELWIEPLDLETLPPINTNTNLWGKLHTMASEHERKNSQKKMLKDRSKAIDKHQKGVDEAEEKRAKELARLEKKEQKARDDSSSGKIDEKLRKIDQKREKVEMKHSERMEKVAEDRRAKDKEAKAMAKVLWLIIRNAHE